MTDKEIQEQIRRTSLSRDELRRLAKKYPPSPEWYEEDFEKPWGDGEVDENSMAE